MSNQNVNRMLPRYTAYLCLKGISDTCPSYYHVTYLSFSLLCYDGNTNNGYHKTLQTFHRSICFVLAPKCHTSKGWNTVLTHCAKWMRVPIQMHGSLCNSLRSRNLFTHRAVVAASAQCFGIGTCIHFEQLREDCVSAFTKHRQRFSIH